MRDFKHLPAVNLSISDFFSCKAMMKLNIFSFYDYIEHNSRIFTKKILRFNAGRYLKSLALVRAYSPLVLFYNCPVLNMFFNIESFSLSVTRNNSKI